MNELQRAELQALVDAAINIAAPLLIKNKQFQPFGLSVGLMRNISVYAFANEEIKSTHETMQLGFKMLSDLVASDMSITAVALAFEGLARNDHGSVRHPDVLMVQIDSRGVPPVTYHVPFKIERPLIRKPSFQIVANVYCVGSERFAFAETSDFRT